MSPWSKLFIAAGVMVLLGLGLCGMDALHPTTTHADEIADLALFGFALCLLAVATLVVGSIWLAATQDPTGRRPPPPPRP